MSKRLLWDQPARLYGTVHGESVDAGKVRCLMRRTP